jgi:hypothetical protein
MRKAAQIMNNMLNRKTGYSPKQALAEGQRAVRSQRDFIRKGRAAYTKGKQPHKPLDVGSLVRKLAIRRKDRTIGYKSYRAKQWSEQTYTIEQRARQGKAWKYKISSGEWKWQDQLQVVDVPDETSKQLVAGRANVKESDEIFYAKADEEYDPEDDKPKAKKKKAKPKAKAPKAKPKRRPSKVRKPRSKIREPPKREVAPRRSSRRKKRVDYAAVENKYAKVF